LRPTSDGHGTSVSGPIDFQISTPKPPSRMAPNRSQPCVTLSWAVKKMAVRPLSQEPLRKDLTDLFARTDSPNALNFQRKSYPCLTMESALQVDLARREASSKQVPNSSLGQTAFHPTVSSTPLLTDADPTSHNSAGRSRPGGYAASIQVRLKPKVSRDDPSPEPSMLNSLEFGEYDDATRVYNLQPMDEGFGAWSYVASAFAMYIVVWGRLPLRAT
jgi:hypothetical protein